MMWVETMNEEECLMSGGGTHGIYEEVKAELVAWVDRCVVVV